MKSTNIKLDRVLTLWPIIIFGLAYMTPLIVLATFGLIASHSKGAVPTAFLITTIAMLFTAYSYGIMSKAYPVAGSAYTYVRKTIDARAGFMVGWAILMDYFFLPMVIWLIGAAYLSAQFPTIPIWIFLVGFIVITTALNIFGLKVATTVNSILMVFQVLVIVIFVFLSLRHVIGIGGLNAAFSFAPFFNDQSTFATIASGSAVAAYCFLGFDAITTLTEETINPKETIPKAIIYTALIGGFIYMIVGYTTQLVHPGGEFQNPDSAALEIAKMIGQDMFASFFLAGLVLAQFTSGIAAQASCSRLLFAMGRDAVLPKVIFGKLSPKYHTPVISIILTGLVGLLALFMDVLSAASFINFGAFLAFTMVNLSVVFMFFRKKGPLDESDRGNILSRVIVPIIGAVINIGLMTQLDSKALILGAVWFVLGTLYLVYLTGGLKNPPPEMDFVEDENVDAITQS